MNRAAQVLNPARLITYGGYLCEAKVTSVTADEVKLDRQDLARSNSLTDLAARIRIEHEATAAALQRGVMHAMAAGDLLIEAKAQLKHGQWLPWLAKHCVISERTAQLYVKLAKNRTTIEKEQIRNDVADLTLNEAAALCVLAGRLDKLIEFAKRCETASPEEIVSLCVQQGFGCFTMRITTNSPAAQRQNRHNERHREVLLGQPRSGADLRRNPQHASLIQEWTGSRRERLVVTEKVAALGVV
jgi:hypothetical protein